MSPEPLDPRDTFRRRLRGRAARHRHDDSGMALMMTITCVIVSVALVTALLGALRSELAPVAYERRTARSMAAAEAGLQAELSVIRSAWAATPRCCRASTRPRWPGPSAGPRATRATR